MPSTFFTLLPGWAVTFFLLLIHSVPGVAQNFKVMQVNSGGKAVQEIIITAKKPEGANQKYRVRAGTVFPSGTIIQTDQNTSLFIASSSSGYQNQQLIQSNTRHVAEESEEGEKHRTFWGSVLHYVRRKLNFYRASGPSNRVQGAVEGTTFMVTVDQNKRVGFATQEGRVVVNQQRPVQIRQQIQGGRQGGARRNHEHQMTTNVNSNVTAGSSQYFDPSYDQPVVYNTYNEAIRATQQAINNPNYQFDYGYISDEYALLGELYLNDGDPRTALQYFQKANNLLWEYDPLDPFIPENQLLMSDALIELRNLRDAFDQAKEALDFLGEDLEFAVEDYNYFVSIGDNQTAWSIGWDVVDIYDRMDWAYENMGYCLELSGQTQQADQYYNQSELYFNKWLDLMDRLEGY